MNEGYLGTAIVISTTSPVPVHEGLGEGNLPKLAASIRDSIKAAKPQAASEMVAWTADLHDPRFATVAINVFMGMGLAITSWQVTTPCRKHDCGFGPTKALRLPRPQSEGYASMTLSRLPVKPGAAGEGIEDCICLEATSHERCGTWKCFGSPNPVDD